mmetsp:Transcript_21161/g.45942  ORF Transcript_21161/g.45942 Transcript_21161/m.45942 type:complete len:98 (-) Transcript_21161:304-597(-)|eukprot:CAMPEP_0168760824 /NCGR_PEP_ID=MMETSP0724-20121128/22973_1 /TAXON_ID=265536 /ORGANISM="Amphiprora sp., Strain CCMP467" /LENGTH=97 /DNA_ID=CAMNT_0008809861 /DNA_START=500 /DNA_END=793 /DNA_ORIENTATION=+
MRNSQQFSGCTSLRTLNLQGPPITAKSWPLLLEQFLQDGNGNLALTAIPNKQRITIAWNIVRTNIANFYLVDEKKKPAYSWKRGILSPGDKLHDALV